MADWIWFKTTPPKGTRSIAVSGHTRQNLAGLAIFPKGSDRADTAHFLVSWHFSLFFLGFSRIHGLESRHEILIHLSPRICPYGFVRHVERC
jgi:hypothetical protein